MPKKQAQNKSIIYIKSLSKVLWNLGMCLYIFNKNEDLSKFHNDKLESWTIIKTVVSSRYENG